MRVLKPNEAGKAITLRSSDERIRSAQVSLKGEGKGGKDGGEREERYLQGVEDSDKGLSECTNRNHWFPSILVTQFPKEPTRQHTQNPCSQRDTSDCSIQFNPLSQCFERRNKENRDELISVELF